MATPKERALLLDEFQNNTGTERYEAQTILNRNNWNLNNSYREIEQLCISSGQKNKYPVAVNPAPTVNAGPSQCNPIDVGLGPAIHLDRQSGNSPQHGKISAGPNIHPQARSKSNLPPLCKSGNPSGGLKNPSSNNQTGRHVIPTNSNNANNLSRERIIPIQVLDNKGQPVACQAASDGKLVGKVPPQGSAVKESRVTLEEPVHPSQPAMLTPAKKEANDDNENDDVFDEKFVTRRPMNAYPRLKRGFSNILENEGIVSEARNNVQTDIRTESHDNMYVQTFVLPNLTSFNGGLRAFLEKELIETSTLVSLEQAGRLNWWAEMHICQRLMPMATTGDGNCLLHAASLAMWGIHDRQLILRKELHETLTNASYKEALYRRWRYQQTLANKESGLVFNEAEWKEEWANVLRLASALPRGAPDPSRMNNCCDNPVVQGNEDPVVYESLEEFHVFVLAHVLQRPIIVVADTFLKSSSGEALAPIPFSGIYLPLEVHPCYRSPLLLTYDAAHFSALAPMEQDSQESSSISPAAIPLMDPELKLLPIHFHVDPGSHVDWSKDRVIELSNEDKINLLQKLLDVERIPFRSPDTNGDSDLGSCGSQDSDESGIIMREKDKKKEEKKTGGKTFGSFGKSVGKKLKQLGKSKGDKQPRRPSLRNTVTQSTTITPVENYSPRDFVLVARLSEKRGKQQQEMIRNYLQDARARFKRDHELKRRSDIELRSRIAPHPAVNSAASCKTPGCPMVGSQDFHFYCPKCFALKQEEMNKFQYSGNQFVYNTFPGRARQAATSQSLAPEDVFRCGKSKFYTSSDEKIDQAAASSNNLMPSNLDKASSQSSGNINLTRGRSPSPDYDNVEYTRPAFLQCREGGERRVDQTTAKPTSQEQRKCRTPNCEFYGNPAADYLCSKCYQKQYQTSLQIANINASSTHL